MRYFPKNFYFGAATSGHQVEGGNYNDWTEWERETATRKAEKANQKSWPDYILRNFPGPLQKENYISGDACDHYRRFEKDFDLAKGIGLNAYRFSIEWSRIEPEEGKFDEKEIAHYREVLEALRGRGLEPFVTLWHWTHPLWFAEKGGWEAPDAVFHFSRFAGYVAKSFKNDVRYWITLNEPGLWASSAYFLGVKPPEKKDFFSFVRVYFALLRAHRVAYGELKNIDGDFQVGMAESMSWNHISLVRPLMLYFKNYFFIARSKKFLDFIGVNYYRPVGVYFHNPPRSDMNWEIYPRGLYFILKHVYRSFRKPVFITENGIADAKDAMRGNFIKKHLSEVSRAIEKGADVRGYFYWSLLDNFEWQDGFWSRFGLIEVDYKNQERKVRQSAREFTKLIAEYRKEK